MNDEKIEKLLRMIRGSQPDEDTVWDDGSGYWPVWSPYKDYVEAKRPELRKYYEESNIEKLVEIMEEEDCWKMRELAIRFIVLYIKNGKKISELHIEKIAERLEKDESPYVSLSAIKALGIAMEYGMEVTLEKVAEELSTTCFIAPVDEDGEINWSSIDWSVYDRDPTLFELEPVMMRRLIATSFLKRAIELGKEIPMEVIMKKLENDFFIVREAAITVLEKAAEEGLKIPVEKIKEKLEDKLETEYIRESAKRILESLEYQKKNLLYS